MHLGIDRDDLVQNASIGLLEAIERFDPSRGVPFRAYALRRVRGAVFNGLRALKPQAGLHRVAVIAERAQSVADDEAGDLDYLGQFVAGLGLGLLLSYGVDGLVDAGDAAAHAHAHQLNRRLAGALAGLPARQRDLIEAHYLHHVPFNVWARNAGITKGRVSQIHRDALMRLRAALADAV